MAIGTRYQVRDALTNTRRVENLFTHRTGQIVYPTFISECSRPEDFHKALYAVTVAELTLFMLAGIVVYFYAGQYTQSPAVAVLDPTFRKIAFSFVLPTTIIIGIIYAR
jgi:uncharacterized membrane protein